MLTFDCSSTTYHRRALAPSSRIDSNLLGKVQRTKGIELDDLIDHLD